MDPLTAIGLLIAFGYFLLSCLVIGVILSIAIHFRYELLMAVAVGAVFFLMLYIAMWVFFL